MASNFFIFDHFTRPLVQIDADTTPRGWVLNDVGRAEFAMGIDDPKFLEKNVQYNNLVHIQHIPKSTSQGKLPDWTGIILPKRIWNSSVVNMAAFSAEVIMTLRPMKWCTISGTPRDMFLKILELAMEADQNVVVQPGIVENFNAVFSDDLRGSAYDAIINLIKKTGMTWSVTGQIGQNGELELFAHLRTTSGVHTGWQMNNINSRLHSPIMTEDSIPYNVINGYSFASTARARYMRTGINKDALADYGYMGKNIPFTGLHDPSSTLAAAQVYANTFGRPIRRVGRTALNIGKTFNYLNKGNFLNIDEKGAGFMPDGSIGMKGECRILSMDYNDRTDEVVMNTEIL